MPARPAYVKVAEILAGELEAARVIFPDFPNF